jgi:uncharacterized RDD family membrane protein YckC
MGHAQLTTNGQGVYYAPRDYAGTWRRVAILAIDLGLVLLLYAMLQIAWAVGGEAAGARISTARRFIPFYAWAGLSYLYLTLLRGPRLRTLGFLLSGTRIVDYRGMQPSWLRMNGRIFLGLISLYAGPLHPIVDLMWLGSDGHKQMIKDKMAAVYVVRDRAEPAGHAPQMLEYICLFTVMIPVIEVRDPQPVSAG